MNRNILLILFGALLTLTSCSASNFRELGQAAIDYSQGKYSSCIQGLEDAGESGDISEDAVRLYFLALSHFALSHNAEALFYVNQLFSGEYKFVFEVSYNIPTMAPVIKYLAANYEHQTLDPDFLAYMDDLYRDIANDHVFNLAPLYLELGDYRTAMECIKDGRNRVDTDQQNIIKLNEFAIDVCTNNVNIEYYNEFLNAEPQYSGLIFNARVLLWKALYCSRTGQHDEMLLYLDETILSLNSSEWDFSMPLDIVFPLIPGQRVYEPVREDFEYIKSLIYERMGVEPPEIQE